MQLKRLEINGFKSFADKSVIDFPSGISAVVGPNGCGKSNIMDAIRWVMGEQSIKQLRGKSMGDVIFAGTEKRAPVNLAEVSLIFANHANNAPQNINDYAEVMITRRLYRSGESVYLLNKQPCRLKDIHDIFLRYGMGPKSCAIIQQGNIGAITDATPEDRRTFIEEAAGVARYKTRKQEAIAKVNATRQNLLRLNDIIEEIQKQLNSLSRQAKKARRYKEYKEELKEIDFRVSVHYYEDYSRRISETESLLKSLQDTDALQATELERLNAAITEIEALRRKQDQKISENRTAKSETHRKIDRLENDAKHCFNEKSRLNQEVVQLKDALADLDGKNRRIAEEIAGGREKEETLTIEIREIKEQLSVQEATLRDLKAKLSALNLAHDDKNKRLMSLSGEKARYQNIYHHATQNKENLKRRLKQIETDRSGIEQEVADLAEAEAQVREKQARLKAELDALIQNKTECEHRLRQKSTELGQQIKAVNALAAERQKIRSKLNVLKKMEDNFEWYKDGVKAVMKRVSVSDTGETGENAIIATIAELVDPEPGFEHAVEAVLGDALQYILVRERSVATSAIEYLRETHAGRSGFIVAGASENMSATQPEGGGDIALLKDHVKIRKGFEAILRPLLDRIAVVDDLETALKLYDQQPRRFSKIATKGGDMISAFGVLVGGSKEKLSGILEKKFEVRQLSAQLAECDSELEATRNKQETTESEVRELEQELSGLTQKKYGLESESLETEKSFYKTNEKLKQARRNMEMILLEQKRLLGEEDDIQKEMETHESAIAELDVEIQALEAESKAQKDQIDSLSGEIQSIDHDQMDSKLLMTQKTAELENTVRTLRRLREFEEEGERQRDRIHDDIAKKEQKAQQAAEQLDIHERQIAAEKESLQEIRSRLKSEETGYQSILAQLSQTDGSITETQSKLDQMREKIHRLELELSGLQINRENIVNRFLERYTDSFAQILPEYQPVVIAADFSIEKTESLRAELRKKIDQMGEVNMGAISAHDELSVRYDFLIKHRDDLNDAINDLESVIRKINRITQKLFIETFDAINEKFKSLFPRLFNGGSAWLELTQPDQPLETGVELMIHPPGKKLSRLSLLSGGEKALSAIAFIFSIFLLNPSSFCLLDEIDAPLDDVNVHRFNELIKIIGEKTQIIMITHNKKSMEFSDVLFGVTMAESGVSRTISVNIDQAMKFNTDGSNRSVQTMEKVLPNVSYHH